MFKLKEKHEKEKQSFITDQENIQNSLKESLKNYDIQLKESKKKVSLFLILKIL